MSSRRTRLIIMDGVDPALNMAYDEACVELKDSLDLPTTLRFYRWDPCAVTIGYFQGLDEEVDTRACDERSIKYIRRLTGGGAVYHDYNGEVTYSLVISRAHPLMSDNIRESYRSICSSLISGLSRLGITSAFRPINDIVVGHKKISGNAQTRRKKEILQHGTILCDVNPTLMFTLLKVPDEKLKDKIIKKVEQSVTSIKQELGSVVDHKKVIESLAQGFAEKLNLDLYPADFTDEEKELALKLIEQKYADERWNRRR